MLISYDQFSIFSHNQQNYPRAKILPQGERKHRKNPLKACQQAGISQGGFYLFFESKKALLCEAIYPLQEQLCEISSHIIEQPGDKQAVPGIEADLPQYRKYCKNNFLYHTDSGDFTLFMNRLSWCTGCQTQGCWTKEPTTVFTLAAFETKGQPGDGIVRHLLFGHECKKQGYSPTEACGNLDRKSVV